MGSACEMSLETAGGAPPIRREVRASVLPSPPCGAGDPGAPRTPAVAGTRVGKSVKSVRASSPGLPPSVSLRTRGGKSGAVGAAPELLYRQEKGWQCGFLFWLGLRWGAVAGE